MNNEEREIINKTKELIDELKSISENNGIGNSPSEYKIITEVFLYKFLNDKFLYEIKKVDENLAKLDKPKDVEKALEKMKDDYEFLLLRLGPDTAKLKIEHLISYLFSHKNDEDFYKLFDDTLIDIANFNIDIFSVRTGGKEKIRLFSGISQHITETNKKNNFARAIIDKLVEFSFENLFKQKYDAFAIVFEYLIKDYNKDFGKYAEYYTPNSIARIIARILVKDDEKVENVTVYDPSAGSGTLVLALAHQIGEENCSIYTQDISQKSNEFLRLNLILNNLVHSLGNVVHGNTLTEPSHYNENKTRLAKFDYIVSNPPFKTDFSEYRDELADDKLRERFFAGVPKIPNKDKDNMAIYLMFIQHILYSLTEKGKAAIVVPSGFLTDTGEIHSKIRSKIIEDKSIYAVVQMPTNVFANTNTSVSILFLNKEMKNEKIIFVDASHLGKQEKVNDIARIVLSEEEQKKIVNTIKNRTEIAEFSKIVTNDDVIQNDMMLKPGLYFDMIYSELKNYENNIIEFKEIFIQKQRGLINEFSRAYARNLFIKKFITFEGKKKNQETIYGKIPNDFSLVDLNSLVDSTIGGDWGKEETYKSYNQKIYCIRGTDIPNINLYNYSTLPIRFCKPESVKDKQLKANDIVIEISGGSPIQSTGRMCYISEFLINDLKIPVLCTNFCRIIRFKKPIIARYIFDYLTLLYDRKYFFNLENNTTGIKNLLLKSFMKNIKVLIPNDTKVIEDYYKEIDTYVSTTIKKLIK